MKLTKKLLEEMASQSIKESGHDRNECISALYSFAVWLGEVHDPNKIQIVNNLFSEFREALDPDHEVQFEEFTGLLAIFGILYEPMSYEIYEAK